ncbi:hypothetical protein BGX38DRAFT_1200613 [Terfezia claveryi]|nr:hypothetical protein BGX38DRAFT_1200613 [Terfezia claveryi]
MRKFNHYFLASSFASALLTFSGNLCSILFHFEITHDIVVTKTPSRNFIQLSCFLDPSSTFELRLVTVTTRHAKSLVGISLI